MKSLLLIKQKGVLILWEIGESFKLLENVLFSNFQSYILVKTISGRELELSRRQSAKFREIMRL